MLLSDLKNKAMCKNITLIILIAIALAACKSSPVLKDTVLSLKDIKEIGELVTAEYYGEVISGHSLLLVNENIDSVFYKSLTIIRNELAESKEEIGKEYDAKIEINTTKIEELKEKKFAFLKKKRIKKLNKSKEKLEKKKTRKQEVVGTKARSGNFEASMDILSDATGIKRKKELIQKIENQKNDTLLYTEYKQNIKDYFVEDKKELVYIGRGSVKVGYNLKQLDSTNIFYSSTRDTIYLLDFDPYITDLDINPYFYYPADSAYENVDTVYFGFQIIYARNQKKFTLEEINNIKSDCKTKLRQEALKRDIYTNAHTNAEEALTIFFNLMNNENNGQIAKAVISHSKYFYYKSDYLYDLRIDETEYKQIKEIIHQDQDSLDVVSFKYQSLNYQKAHLDKFINDLYHTTRHAENYAKWDSLYTAYVNRKYE